MAIAVNTDTLPEDGERSKNPETKYIPAGPQLARLVSYVEMGMHSPVFNGKPEVYASGKREGQLKDDEFIIGLTFEFPTCEYTGDYPLTISTSIPWNDQFLNKLSIGKALMAGTLSRSFALRAKFVKYLEAFKFATGLNHPNMDAYVDMPFMITVTNKPGKPNKDGVVPIYANMKPEGINSNSMKHPVTGELEVYEVPEAIGTYCKCFDWENPTEEAWKSLRKNVQDVIKKATNYNGSEVQAMVEGIVETPDGTVQDSQDKVAESTNPAPPPVTPGV